jgi:hypothetical protein
MFQLLGVFAECSPPLCRMWADRPSDDNQGRCCRCCFALTGKPSGMTQNQDSLNPGGCNRNPVGPNEAVEFVISRKTNMGAKQCRKMINLFEIS